MARARSSDQRTVRHSVLAISALYEDFYRTGRTIITENRLAINHYNRAIKSLLGMPNESVVLLMCILFVCIEYLQGNRAEGIRHLRHGIHIINNLSRRWDSILRQVAPLFRRLSMMPGLFEKHTLVDSIVVDAKLDTFRELMGVGEKMAAAIARESPQGCGPCFSFDMALPLFHFLVAWCPDLPTRLRGLALIKGHSAAREGFWETSESFEVCRQIVEFEHGVVLGEGDDCMPVGVVNWDAPPLLERRLG